MQTYARPNLVFTRGEGVRLYDAHGKEYLDFAAGIAVNALGMSIHPVQLNLVGYLSGMSTGSMLCFLRGSSCCAWILALS